MTYEECGVGQRVRVRRFPGHSRHNKTGTIRIIFAHGTLGLEMDEPTWESCRSIKFRGCVRDGYYYCVVPSWLERIVEYDPVWAEQDQEGDS